MENGNTRNNNLCASVYSGKNDDIYEKSHTAGDNFKNGRKKNRKRDII